MASVNKKFGIEKGLEVGTDALIVDADNNRTGIGKTDAQYGLDVATTANFDGIVAAGQVGVGSTQPAMTWMVRTDMRLTGRLYDSNNVAGTNGQSLITVGYCCILVLIFLDIVVKCCWSNSPGTV